MVQIARRKWSEILTEAILAGGGHVYTGYSTRMTYWLTEGYYDLCAMYHQYALDQRTVLEPAWDLYLPVSFAGNSLPTELSGCAQRDYSGGCAPGTEIRGIFTAVSRHLGGFIFERNAQTSTGCFVGSPGTHAFRFPRAHRGARSAGRRGCPASPGRSRGAPSPAARCRPGDRRARGRAP